MKVDKQIKEINNQEKDHTYKGNYYLIKIQRNNNIEAGIVF